MSWASPDEAMAYFGIASLDELEDIVVEFDIDCLLDGEGRLIGIQGEEELREALYERHKKEIGHRPDDKEAHEAAVALHLATQDQMKAQRKEQRKVHIEKRVKARREARDGRAAGVGTTGA